MESSLAGMPRSTRRRLIRLERRASDPRVVRRAMSIRRLGEGQTVTRVAREMAAARSSVQAWRDLFVREGETGLMPQRCGPPPSTVTPTLIQQLLALAPHSPRDLGYLRNTWTSELFAKRCTTPSPATIATRRSTN